MSPGLPIVKSVLTPYVMPYGNTTTMLSAQPQEIDLCSLFPSLLYASSTSSSNFISSPDFHLSSSTFQVLPKYFFDFSKTCIIQHIFFFLYLYRLYYSSNYSGSCCPGCIILSTILKSGVKTHFGHWTSMGWMCVQVVWAFKSLSWFKTFSPIFMRLATFQKAKLH